MTVVIELRPEIEKAIAAKATRSGRTVPEYIRDLAQNDAREEASRQAALDLLDSWAEASEEEILEQKETFAAVSRALDEDRAGGRLLFSEQND